MINGELFLKLIAHPIRLALLRRLRNGECCVDSLTQLLNVPQPNISQHLRRLLDANLIAVERRGRNRCYSIADPRVEDVLTILDGSHKHSKN